MNIQFKISGLSCTGCERTSSELVQKIDGVSYVRASKDNGILDIEANRKLSLDEVRAALKETGYEVESL